MIKKSEARDKGVAKIKLVLLKGVVKIKSQWPPGHQNLLLKILKSYCCKQLGTFSPELLSVDALMSVHYRQKCLSSQIEFKLNRFSESNTRHCKNLGGSTHKICSKKILFQIFENF